MTDLADAAIAYEETVMPDDVDFAHIVNGILQVTPDIEDEIAEVDRGETVSHRAWHRVMQADTSQRAPPTIDIQEIINSPTLKLALFLK